MASVTLQILVSNPLATLANVFRKNPTDASYSPAPINASPIPVSNGVAKFIDSTVLAGHIYNYVSTDIQAGVESAFSNQVTTVAVPFPPAPITLNMGDAAGFLVLAGSAITNTGPTTINGDIGVNPGSSITGFPPGALSGIAHSGAGDFVSPRAQVALAVAIAAAKAATNPGGAAPTDLGTAVDIGGKTLGPGVYHAPDSLAITGRLVLDAGGNPQAAFIFVAGTTINLTGDIILVDGAQASNVFWVAGSSATIATGSSFAGTLMADQSITLVTGASVNGRVLARHGAVTMDTNSISMFVAANVGFWKPDHLYDTLGELIADCATGTFQRVVVTGTSGHTIPVFNIGPGAQTKEGPSTPQLTWQDPTGEILVVGPVPSAPPNEPPAPPIPPILSITGEVG